MGCEVEFTDEFEAWWSSLDEGEQDSTLVAVRLLEETGATLGFPYSSGIASSQFSHMRELRYQHQGRPYRVFYAFDPRRVAMLLIGGDKTGNDRYYEEMVRKADSIYAQHLREIGKG